MGWWSEPGCDRVAIIGLGQIGASLGLAVRRAGLASSVAGFDIASEAAQHSLSLGAVDLVTSSAEAAARDADLVILAVPLGAMMPLIARLAPVLRPDAVITDTGSAKTGVIAAMDAALDGSGGYVGGHPMSGNEGSGPGSAAAELIVGCRYVLCPGPRTDARALSRLRSLLAAIPVTVIEMPGWIHDRRVAWISHLPYLVAVGLCLGIQQGLAGDEVAFSLAAGAFADGTRTAGSGVTMAGDYCFANRSQLVEALAGVRTEIDSLVAVLEGADRSQLDSLLARARGFRSRVVGSLG